MQTPIVIDGKKKWMSECIHLGWNKSIGFYICLTIGGVQLIENVIPLWTEADASTFNTSVL